MQVPVLQSRVSPDAAPNIQRRPLQSTVGQSLSQGFGAASAQIDAIQKQETLKADRAGVMDAENATDTVVADLVTKASTRKLKDAINVTPDVMAEYDAQTSKIEQGLKSDRQKETYRAVLKKKRSEIYYNVLRHELNEKEAYYAKSRDDYKAQAHINATTYYNDPARVESEIGKVRAAIDQTPGLDDAQKATELGVRRAGIYTAVIDRYLANDQIKQAEGYYKGVKDHLGDHVARVENALIDAKARIASAQKAAAINGEASRVLTRYASDGPEAGAAMLSDLAKRLPPEVMGEVYSKVQTNLNHARNAKQDEHSDEITSIYRSISTGVAGPEQIASVETLWKDNAFTPTERASLIGRIEASQISHAGDRAAAAAIRESLQSGVPLDPSNGEHRKALSAAFNEDARESPVGSPQWQGLAVAYAARTRMLPDQATSWVRAAIRSPDPKIAAPAAQFLGAVEASAGDAASGFDSSTKAFAGMANSMIEAGTPPEKAIETARQTVFEQKPAIVEQRKTEYRAAAKESAGALNSLIDRDMDTLFTGQPGSSAPWNGLRTDFNKQAEQYYLKTGDIALARELAWKDLQRVYGTSEVNGVKQVMAAPPERFGVKPEEVRADIASFLTGTTATVESAMKDVKRTDLPPAQEKEYRAWLEKIGMTKEKGYRLDDNYTGSDYDMRGFFKKYGPADINVKGGQHFTDEFKLPNHESFSTQSMYARGSAAELAGTWNGDTYVPAKRRTPNPQSDGSTADDIILVPDAVTLRATASIMDGKPQSPSYKLLTKSGDLVLDKQGIPVRYTLPTGEDLAARIKAEQDAATEKAKQQVAEARAERDARARRAESLLTQPPRMAY